MNCELYSSLIGEKNCWTTQRHQMPGRSWICCYTWTVWHMATPPEYFEYFGGGRCKSSFKDQCIWIPQSLIWMKYFVLLSEWERNTKKNCSKCISSIHQTWGRMYVYSLPLIIFHIVCSLSVVLICCIKTGHWITSQHSFTI